MIRSRFTSRQSDIGAAAMSAIMMMFLLSAVTVATLALAITDTRVRTMDGTRTQAFYSAHAGLEKLTADLGDLFSANFAPTGAMVNALTVSPPALGVTWQAPDGSSGYTIAFPTDPQGDPLASTTTVNSGPFQGLVGLATSYRMTATAQMGDNSEASVTRTLQTIAIPVFQFGLFSENDLSFFAGPNFNFGGRVHSNKTIYLASGSASTLTLSDRVTSVEDVVRTNLSNGWDTSTNYTGPVRVITAPGAYRNLTRNEGSLTGTIGSADNEPTWTNLSTGTYNYNIMNGRTGAKRLDLPVVSLGASPVDLVRRPVPNEDVTNPGVLDQRFFTMASLRILLSDTAADITNLPTVTPQAPVELGINEPAGYAVTAVTPEFARSRGPGAAGDQLGIRTPTDTPLLGGFLKVEMQTAAGNWQDVTVELLNLGISGDVLPDPTTGAPVCGVISPNAVIRLQMPRDQSACPNAAWLANDYNYSSMSLYDTREAVQRDNTANGDPVRYNGIMHYVEVDANNLRRWFQGAIGVSGNQALNLNGYVLYFSDRRGNRNALGNETGEYGFEDIVNPLSAVGLPNGILDTGEDFNENGILDVYGQVPRLPYGVAMWADLGAPLLNTTRPWDGVNGGGNETEEINIAKRNPPIFFRRALKLTNGGLGNIVTPGFTVASENPVYVQGNWNASNAGYGNPHAATAVIADAVTLLSNAWNDRRSFIDPHDANPRDAATTWYRLAIIAGKGVAFPQPAGTPQDFGTDGGAHNFLRYLEDWGGRTLNYRGSIVSLFTSRQNMGVYKCCADVYKPPTRGYAFDVEFLTPALLPPRTPMFRDVNITGFSFLIRPQ